MIPADRLAAIRARLTAYPEPIGVVADDLDLSGDTPRVHATLHYRSDDRLPATGSPYASLLTHASADLAALLAEVDALTAEVEALHCIAAAAARVIAGEGRAAWRDMRNAVHAWEDGEGE